MISKLRFSALAVIMLVLLGFGFNNQAQAQVGGDGLFCPAIPFSSGWLEVEVEPGIGQFPDFSGALFGTVDSLIGGPLHGGMDWQHVDFTTSVSPTPTNEVGSQLVSWWTQKDGRNTYLQVTNAIGNQEVSTGTWVHVHIFDENCIEIRNFCDFYTEFDTHVYNLGDLVSNGGQELGDANLQGKEGFITVTATNDCPNPAQAIQHNQLAGNTFIKSVSDSDYLYGFATYHRRAVCEDELIITTVNLIENGSFQNGNPFGPWFLNQGRSTAIEEANISVGTVPIPPASGPDADDPNSNEYMGFLVSSAEETNSGTYQGGAFSELATPNLVIQGPQFETNVTVISSNTFTTDESETLLYDLSFINPGVDPIVLTNEDVDARGVPDEDCANYAMVCVIDASSPGAASFQDCECYATTDDDSSPTNSDCIDAGSDNNDYNVIGGGGSFDFTGGRSGFFTNQTLDIPGPGTWVVQVITAQEGGDNGCDDEPDLEFNSNTGAFVDNFRVIVEEIEVIECDFILDGSEEKFLDVIVPNRFAAQFDAQAGTAGGDAVHINFYDEYLPTYTPQAAFINAVVGIYNDVEQFESCGEAEVCFIRLGVDEAVILSDNFVGPPTTSPPTTAPTLGPTTPTAPPTTTPGGGGGNGSCAIAGGPVQLGTAFANVLIPLVPVAFVFGIRAMRRRKK